MARKPRVRARSGGYHVLMQGVRHRDISQAPERMKVWDAEHYPYSSWHEYAGQESELPRICEVPAGYQRMSQEEMVRILSAPVPRQAACIGPLTEEMRRPKDDQVLVMLHDMTKTASMMDFLGLPRAEQLQTLADLRKKGASIRQLEKLTGIGRGVIQNL